MTIYYKDCQPLTQFIEGDILGFIRNKVILSNDGAVETADAVLPFEELVEKKDWNSIKRLCDIGPNREQLEFLATASIRDKKFDVARLVSPEVSKTLSFFVNEVLVNTPKSNVSNAIAQFLGDNIPNYALDKSSSQHQIQTNNANNQSAVSAVNQFVVSLNTFNQYFNLYNKVYGKVSMESFNNYRFKINGGFGSSVLTEEYENYIETLSPVDAANVNVLIDFEENKVSAFLNSINTLLSKAF